MKTSLSTIDKLSKDNKKLKDKISLLESQLSFINKLNIESPEVNEILKHKRDLELCIEDFQTEYEETPERERTRLIDNFIRNLYGCIERLEKY